HGALRATGAVGLALMEGRADTRTLLSVVLVVACMVIGTIVAAAVSRVTAPWPRRVGLIIITAAYTVVGVRLSLLRPDLHYFGSLSTYAPNMSWTEYHPVRPQITYRTNSFGFREPDFVEKKPSATTRVVLVGDSYVFGIGVDND